MSPQGDFHSVAGRCFKDLSEALIHEKNGSVIGDHQHSHRVRHKTC